MKQYLSVLLVFTCTILLFQVSIAQTWSAVSSGFGPAAGVDAMMVYKNELYVSGVFLTAGSTSAVAIARWNGTAWNSVGAGITQWGSIYSFCQANGELYAAGQFPNMGGISSTTNLAKWNGSNWFSVSSAATNSSIYAAQYTGDLYAGGNFVQVGSLSVNRIAKWNGTNWSNMSGGVTGGFIPQVKCMAIYNGELYVGGDFTFAGGKSANFIAKWNGTQWDSVGTGLNDQAMVMFVDTIHNLLYVSGGFTIAGGMSITQGLAKWDGTTWSNVGLPAVNLGPNSFALYRGKLFMGYYSNTASITDTIFASWDGTNWKRIEGPNDGVSALGVYNDKLYLGGYFSKIHDNTQGWLTVNYIASYWEPSNTVNEWCQSLKFKIYPNPAKREINIELTASAQPSPKERGFVARIKNALGQNVFEQTFEKELKINTSDFKQGIYFVEVCTAEGVVCHTEKVVIE